MRRGSIVSLCLFAGCGNTIDFLGPGLNSEGIATLGQESGSSTTAPPDTTGGPGTQGTASMEGTSSGAGPTGSEASTAAPTCAARCEKLDLLVVLDNTDLNEGVREALIDNVSALAVVVANPSASWAGDFHVGFVPTNDGGTLAQCRIAGALSATPNSGQPIPCISSSGRNFADQDDLALTTVLGCFANVEPVGPPAPPRQIALATARGFGLGVAEDPMGDDVATSCNTDFVRPDSLKVAIIIAAADDGGSPGSPPTWAQWLEPLRELDPCSELVVVAVVPEDPAACSPIAANVIEWLGVLEGGTTSDWCEFRETNALSGVQDLAAALEGVCQ